jgi:acyl-CoA reductase-like NAD-dependent aldehyde dehydrogenase
MPVAVAAKVSFETRMLVDGKLVEGEAGMFDNLNPATEEVLGQVSDASKADMHRAIDAGRRAFDHTDWSTNRELRKRCLNQLQDAIEAEREELREELIAEVGCPRMVTHGPQLDLPLDSALRYPIGLIDDYPWHVDLGNVRDARSGQLTSRAIWKQAVGVVGCITPWNYPFEVTLNKLGQALATGNTVVLKPAPDTPFNATVPVELAMLIGMAPCMHAGQGCAVPTRMLIHRSLYDEGVSVLEEMYRNVAVGDPHDPGTLCGPVISAKQRERVLWYIQNGIDEGARLVVGGTEAPHGLDEGYFVRPTLFADVDNSMTIAQEEIFGPVLTVTPFDDDDHAVRIANDSAYGLAGYVLSDSVERSKAIGGRVRAGMISMNGGAAFGPDVPFGGCKDSGVGRQNGHAGFDQYLETKSVAWPAVA